MTSILTKLSFFIVLCHRYIKWNWFSFAACQPVANTISPHIRNNTIFRALRICQAICNSKKIYLSERKLSLRDRRHKNLPGSLSNEQLMNLTTYCNSNYTRRFSPSIFRHFLEYIIWCGIAAPLVNVLDWEAMWARTGIRAKGCLLYGACYQLEMTTSVCIWMWYPKRWATPRHEHEMVEVETQPFEYTAMFYTPLTNEWMWTSKWWFDWIYYWLMQYTSILFIRV